MYIEDNIDLLGFGKRIQPWSSCDAFIHEPYYSTQRVDPVSNFYQHIDHSEMHPLQLWRPGASYENVALVPLTTKTMPNYAMDPINNNMSTQPIKFPNLVNSYQKNPAQAARSAFYTRFTPNEWFDKQIKCYNESDANRHYSERMRKDAIKIMREAEEKIQQGQYDTGRRLGERISDVTFWRNEVASELERLVQEIERLQNCRSVLEKALQDTEGPLHIAEECLYHREARKGTELVHDDCEKSLLQEVQKIRGNQRKLEICLDKCKDQLRNCRASQNQLELDLKNKESALNIDSVCHQLNNYSHGLQYYSGIEKCDPCKSEQETWAEWANRIIQKSQSERVKSAQQRADAETLVNRVAQEIWESWSSTNNALARRTSEMIEAKNKLQQHIHKLQQEIFDVEKNMELLRKAISDKSHALKVAHTRLEARMHRPEVELCRDHAHVSLQKEIDEINRQVERMHKTLKEMENHHQRLLRTRCTLEHDLALKIDAMYIDKEKVCGMRRAYPVNALFRY